MTPVAIGDTQGTLQARKTCITPYKCPETLIWVYMEVLQSLVPMTMGFNNKPCLFSLFSLFSTMGYFWQNFGKMGVGQYSQMSWRASQSVPATSSHLLISWKMSPLKPVPQAELWTGKTWQKHLQTYQRHVIILKNVFKKFQAYIFNS